MKREREWRVCESERERVRESERVRECERVREIKRALLEII
jgi:hypothetical protein